MNEKERAGGSDIARGRWCPYELAEPKGAGLGYHPTVPAAQIAAVRTGVTDYDVWQVADDGTRVVYRVKVRGGLSQPTHEAWRPDDGLVRITGVEDLQRLADQWRIADIFAATRKPEDALTLRREVELAWSACEAWLQSLPEGTDIPGEPEKGCPFSGVVQVARNDIQAAIDAHSQHGPWQQRFLELHHAGAFIRATEETEFHAAFEGLRNDLAITDETVVRIARRYAGPKPEIVTDAGQEPEIVTRDDALSAIEWAWYIERGHMIEAVELEDAADLAPVRGGAAR